MTREPDSQPRGSKRFEPRENRQMLSLGIVQPLRQGRC